MSHSYRDLRVWNLAVDFVEHVYQTTRDFPRSERFGLVSQLQRAAVSVPSNIAEGQGRLSKREFRQFLGQARASLLEVETQLIISKRLGYLNDSTLGPLLEEAGTIKGMLSGLIDSLERSAAGAA